MTIPVSSPTTSTEPVLEVDLSKLNPGDEVEVTTRGGSYRLTVTQPEQGQVRIIGRPIYHTSELRYITDTQRQPVVHVDQGLWVYLYPGFSIPVNTGMVRSLKVKQAATTVSSR